MTAAANDAVENNIVDAERRKLPTKGGGFSWSVPININVMRSDRGHNHPTVINGIGLIPPNPDHSSNISITNYQS